MAAAPQPELAASLKAGLDALTGAASVTFTRYVRVVLPLDGFVFWVNAAVASPTAVAAAGSAGLPPTVTVKGSLHFSTDKGQSEDETAASNQVIFTAQAEVNDLNAPAPGTMMIARLDPDGVPYAFSARGRYFKQADLYHYVGDAVMPAVRTQIVDDPGDLAALSLVVSDSLPAWLSLNCYEPPYPGFVTGVTLYPSFAVPENLAPPYGAVHIDPSSTVALSIAPVLGPTLGRQQPARDRVRITLYGLDNDQASTFLDAVLQYSADYNILGMAGMPILRDEKRTAREIGVLAMKKTIEVEVNYLQGSMRNLARQLVEQVVTDYRPTPVVPLGRGSR